MRAWPWLVSACLVACSDPRPTPTGGGDPIGPRSVPELEALVGDGPLSLRRSFRFGFESADEFADFYVTPSPHLGTTRQALSPAAFAGASAHHAWIEGANEVIPGENTNHRGYPTLQLQKTAEGPLQGIVVIEFMAWLNLELEERAGREWFSFITVTSYADDTWPRTVLFNLDADGVARLMHVPGQQQRGVDVFQSEAPFGLRRWVKLSMVLDFTSENAAGSPLVRVFLDDELSSAATFNPRIDPLSVDRSLWPPCLDTWNGERVEDAEALCDLVFAGGVAQAHLGMYAPPLIAEGDVYNDELYLYELQRQ